MSAATEVTQEARNAAARAIADDDTIEPDSCGMRFAGCGTSWSWLVLTDEEADERATDAIKDSLWAFRTEFLQSYVIDHLNLSDLDEYRSKACEDANTVVAALVANRLGDLIRDAIDSDGRGHFLSGWNGEEVEYQDETGRYWYGYRQ